MILLVLTAVWLTAMVVVFAKFSRDSYGPSWGEIAFDAGISVMLCSVGFMLLLVAVIAIGNISMGPWQAGNPIVSDEVSVERTGKHDATIKYDGNEIRVSKSNMSVSTASNDEEIQKALDEGKIVLVPETASSDLTCLMWSRLAIYANGKAANIMEETLSGIDSEEEDDA